MTIAPIKHAVRVKAAPDRAFALFASEMERWWPVGRTVGQNPHVAIIIEPHPEGRWFERDAEGNETQWGKVLAWDPPTRLLLGWQLNSRWTYDPTLLTEVELTFEPEPTGGTRVTLEHRNLERFGGDAERVAGQISVGWPGFMAEFATWADAQSQGDAVMSDFIVHTIPGSPFARAVMATLEEKGAPWRLAALTPGAHRAEPHLSRNPFARMPAMEHGDFTLYETSAILRYLDRVLPSPPLTPTDPRAAARMDQVMSINDWYLFQGVGSVIGFQRVVGPMVMGLTPDEALIAAAMPQAQTVFGVLSGILGDHAYFAGEAVSLADLLVAPQIDFLAQTPEWIALTADRPNIAAWLARMNARPSLAATTMSKVVAMAAAA